MALDPTDLVTAAVDLVPHIPQEEITAALLTPTTAAVVALRLILQLPILEEVTLVNRLLSTGRIPLPKRES